MSPKDNSKYSTGQFKVMMNKEWLPLEELRSITKHFYTESRKAYGRTFIVKRNKMLKKYGVFIKERRRQTRIEMDKEYDKIHNIVSVSHRDFMLFMLDNKKAGVSILKNIVGRIF